MSGVSAPCPAMGLGWGMEAQPSLPASRRGFWKVLELGMGFTALPTGWGEMCALGSPMGCPQSLLTALLLQVGGGAAARWPGPKVLGE